MTPPSAMIRSAASAAPATRLPTSSADSRNRPSTHEETISGSVLSGPPDARADPEEIRGSEAVAQGLQAVVTGQATAGAHPDLAERQIDLVIEHDHPLERHLSAPRTGPADWPASFM